jgi:hypothetical protein
MPSIQRRKAHQKQSPHNVRFHTAILGRVARRSSVYILTGFADYLVDSDYLHRKTSGLRALTSPP